MTYSLKKSTSRKLADTCRWLVRSRFFYSDHFVRYPAGRRYNKHILNLHRQRWENPSGKIGLHYESVQNLLQQSCDRTVQLWEKIESSLYGGENTSIFDDLQINAYTGDNDLTYDDMKLKEPIRLTM